jgi:hypothetical protein
MTARVFGLVEKGEHLATEVAVRDEGLRWR